MTPTLAKIQDIFRDVFDNDSLALQPEMTAANVDGWDSLTHIDLIVAIERAFKVRFTTAEVGSLANVGQLAALVDGKLSSAG